MDENLIFGINNETGELEYNRTISDYQVCLEQELSNIYDGKKISRKKTFF